MMKNILSMLLIAILFAVSGCSKDDDSNLSEQFTVTFDSQGGSAVASKSVESGGKVSKPESPTKNKAVFINWYKEAACTHVWNFDSDLVIDDITLYAKWADKAYTITFNTNGGSTIEPQPVAEGGIATPPLPPTKSGAAFDGWYTEAALTNVYTFENPVTADLTLYAKWKAVTLETLQKLVNECYLLNRSKYTEESFGNLSDKLNAIERFLESTPSPTPEQILEKYTELSNAINALVETIYHATAKLEIYPTEVNGFIYVNPGEEFALHIQGVDDLGNSSTNPDVIFTNFNELEAWAETGSFNIEGQRLYFTAKATLSAGTTITITVTSAEFPTIAKTLKLKVAEQSELKNLFLEAVSALPSPDKITYEHHDAILKAYDIYFSLPETDLTDPAVQSAYDKLEDCEDVLPVRLLYSFTGNVCKITFEDEEETIYCDFAADGEFPAGTYTMSNWEGDKGDYYRQKFELTSNKVFRVYEKKANNPEGNNATDWIKETAGTYTFTGTQARGGYFEMSYDNSIVRAIHSNSKRVAMRTFLKK